MKKEETMEKLASYIEVAGRARMRGRRLPFAEETIKTILKSSSPDECLRISVSGGNFRANYSPVTGALEVVPC